MSKLSESSFDNYARLCELDGRLAEIWGPTDPTSAVRRTTGSCTVSALDAVVNECLCASMQPCNCA